MACMPAGVWSVAMVDVGVRNERRDRERKARWGSDGRVRWEQELRAVQRAYARVTADVVEEGWFGTDRPFRRHSGAGSEPVEFRSSRQVWGHLGTAHHPKPPVSNPMQLQTGIGCVTEATWSSC